MDFFQNEVTVQENDSEDDRIIVKNMTEIASHITERRTKNQESLHSDEFSNPLSSISNDSTIPALSSLRLKKTNYTKTTKKNMKKTGTERLK